MECVLLTSEYQRGPNPLQVLLPDRMDRGSRHRVLYILPVNAGTDGPWGSGIEEAARLGLHNRYDLICAAPAFDRVPWYADHPTDPKIRQESYLLNVVLPHVERSYPALAEPSGRLLVGFSKSGWGAFSLLLRHPEVFGGAASWDAPLALTSPGEYGSGQIFGTQENFDEYRVWSLLDARAELLRKLPARLGLLGFGSFRTDTEQTHEKMVALGIPHVYENSIERPHDWRSGWLEGAVGILAGL